jgi:predicted DNA-binding ribbon-helix-helix protein
VLIKRSFSLAGHRTSVALEQAFWEALEGIAAARGISLSTLVSEADSQRAPSDKLASSLRVLALRAAGAG